MPVVDNKHQIRELFGTAVVSALATVSRYARILVVCLLPALTASRQLAAQSLGDEVILSRLGDPVEIEIAVKDWQKVDLAKVSVTNATHQQYDSFKLSYLPLLDSLNFNVVGPNLAGEVKVLISSRKPLAEPFLDLLLVMKWPQGSATREYVLLFDPPLPNFSGAGEARREPTPSASTNKQPAVKTELPRQLTKPANDPPQTRPSPAAATKAVSKAERPDVRTQAAIEVDKVSATATSPVDDGRRQYRVRNGDSLWNIARQFYPAGIGENLYQFLISLHDLNRDAFINGNISLLKADAQLHIPAARDIATINPASAQTVFDQLWRDGVRSPDPAAPGQSAPQFKPLNESEGQKAQTVKTPEPKLPPGTEKQEKTAAPASPLLPAAGAIISASSAQAAPVQTASNATVPVPVPVIQLTPQQTRTTDPRATNSGTNPYLQKITESATIIQGLLETRRQRLGALEQQILAMQAEMRQAQQRAAELNQGLSSKAEVTRKAILLGALAAVLLILLMTTLWYSLKWGREIQGRKYRRS